MNLIKLTLTSFLLTTLIACGGGSPDKETEIPSLGDEPTTGGAAEDGEGTEDGTDTEGGTDGEDESVTSQSGRNVTFLPLSIYETSKNHSGLSKENVHITEPSFPFIDGVMLSIYDSKTLALETGTVDDFVITEDEQVVDPLESFPVLQKVGVIPTFLHTAIVIDVSGSVRNFNPNPLPKVITEAKAIIAQAQASEDPVIKEQRFTIWAFGRQVKELTSGFTEDATILNAALDSALNSTLYDELKSTSSLNQALVQSIGRYDGQGAGSKTFTFRDNATLGNTNNDLIEGVSTERIQLSSLIVITSGAADKVFTDEQVKVAIESQSQLVFKEEGDDQDSEQTEVSLEVTKNLGKPFIAVLVGNSTRVQSSIADNASHIIDLREKSVSEISFASTVLGHQSELINFRKREGNRYLLRYASVYRDGKHESLITTGAVNTRYSLTGEFDFAAEVNVDMPNEVYIPGVFSSVEITGEGDQYLQRSVNINNTNAFYPATRWTNVVYPATDYTWQLDGNALTADSATGAVTLVASDLLPSGISTLSLTNLALGETTSIQVTSTTLPIIQIFEAGTRRILGGQVLNVADLNYIDRNANAEPSDDPNAPSPSQDLVYQINFEDFNVPLESYQYSINITGLTEGTDYNFINSGIQIKEQSIEDLNTAATITINNVTLGSTSSFTINL